MLDTFLEERNTALLSGDIDKVIAHQRKWSPDAVMPSREVVEISMHKARTACTQLPMEARQESKVWLETRGYESIDDRDIPAALRGRLAPTPSTVADAANELQGTLSPAEESVRLALPVEQSSPEALQRACNQIEKAFPPDPEALWRAGLEAEMRPIAQRAGRKLFTLCASINNAHVGLGLIAQVAQQTKTTLIQLHARQAAAAVVQKLHHTSVVLDNAIAALITGCAEASGFTREQIIEVQTDMLRARQLAQAAPPSGIVLPGGGH